MIDCPRSKAVIRYTLSDVCISICNTLDFWVVNHLFYKNTKAYIDNIRPIVVLLAFLNLPFANAQVLDKKLFVTPPLYQVNKTSDTLVIDGRADEEAWLSAPFIDSFGDIVDHSRDAGLKTRVKMLWDERFVYVYAELKEKDIWATFRQFDSSIFHENAFELFIDADGDGQQYVELQINALGTIWDLFMTKPYRDRGVNVRDWDIKGLKQAVSLSGTLNDPSDRDTCWSIELAIPVSAVVFNQKYVLVEGSMWRMNFSRVQWDIGVVEQEYKKNRDSLGNVIDAKYSVWSPQGVVNLHMPERWGYVVFADKKVGGNEGLHFQERYKQVESRLWKIYYLQKKYKEINGCFASSIEELRYLFPKDVLVREGPVSLKANCFQFWVQYVNDLGKIEMAVDQDGKVYHNLPMEVNSK